MKITIDIDDAVASTVMQNAAAVRGWTQLTDEQIRVKIAQEFADQLSAIAVSGDTVKKQAQAADTLRATLDGKIKTV